MMTVEELIAFEKDIADEFNAGKIPYPVHLSGGNESALIDIFKNIGRRDYICSTWRSHFHALLHGIEPAKVKAAIMAGRSITLTFPEHRFLSSAIVAGMAPIAVGLALAIKRDGRDEKVWCFLGDMAARTGAVHEARMYARGHRLPIVWVEENNMISVCTPTMDTWHSRKGDEPYGQGDQNMSYSYKLPFPHAGAGVRVQF